MNKALSNLLAASVCALGGFAFAQVTPAPFSESVDEEIEAPLESETDIEETANGLIPLYVPKQDEEDGSGFSDLDTADPAAAEENTFDYISTSSVTLRGLDKITGASEDFDVSVGENALFGGLRVSVKACHMAPPTEPPESIAYLEVEDYGFSIEELGVLDEEIDQEKRVFNGWMFASSPGINALEHSIYDVWVIRCTAAEPVFSDSDSEL